MEHPLTDPPRYGCPPMDKSHAPNRFYHRTNTFSISEIQTTSKLQKTDNGMIPTCMQYYSWEQEMVIENCVKLSMLYYSAAPRETVNSFVQSILYILDLYRTCPHKNTCKPHPSITNIYNVTSGLRGMAR